VERQHKIDSENFEVNDVAQLNGADGMLSNAEPPLAETQPGKVFRPITCRSTPTPTPTLRQGAADGRLRATVNVTWLNYWTSAIQFSRDLATDQRVLDPRRSADGAWSRLVHERQRRQSRQLAHPVDRLGVSPDQ
jgi:hypothetical protein